MLTTALLLQLIIRTFFCQAPCTINYRINIDDAVRGELCLILDSDDGQSLASCFPREMEGHVKQGQWKDLPGGTYHAQVVGNSNLRSNIVEMTVISKTRWMRRLVRFGKSSHD